MVDMRCAAFGEVKAFSETEKAIFHLAENVGRLLNIIEQQEQRISQLQDTLFEIAPELEVIEAAADNEEERREMISRYMNLDVDWMGGRQNANESIRANDPVSTEAAGRPRHGYVKYSDRDETK